MRALVGDDVNVRLMAVRPLDADVRKRDVQIVRSNPTKAARLRRGHASTEFATGQFQRTPVSFVDMVAPRKPKDHADPLGRRGFEIAKESLEVAPDRIDRIRLRRSADELELQGSSPTK